jgi:hypothetical protein
MLSSFRERTTLNNGTGMLMLLFVLVVGIGMNFSDPLVRTLKKFTGSPVRINHERVRIMNRANRIINELLSNGGSYTQARLARTFIILFSLHFLSFLSIIFDDDGEVLSNINLSAIGGISISGSSSNGRTENNAFPIAVPLKRKEGVRGFIITTGSC